MSPDPLSLDEWIVTSRPPRNPLPADRPYAYMVEPECAADGRLVDVATLFLTNKECPFRCLMCDLWKNTLAESVAPGQIPEQIRWALAQLPPAQHIKLYNAGSFFDRKAIPVADYTEIARLVAGFERVIVECHPKLVGRSCWEFRDLLAGEFEVAMGLETAHPEVLRRLNKSMTLEDFAQAARNLQRERIASRAFIIVRPPYLSDAEGVEWACRSLDFAFSVGVGCCCLIPTRGGNGVMEELARQGEFAPPSLDAMERAMDYGLSLKAGRVFIDLWDIEKVSPDAPDRAARIARLARMNLSQKLEPAVRGES
ncbi:radical SAM protein [Fimbriiglobus ruber]|uniref:Putative Fe-S oxidoreductase n=1 Tax=Fimbriiglobus ruber TaxID=1908690 RepID=A0A225DPK6_9BACT|nr:radical SAM protein [Fimbriiglobus ruber]OWK38295.1 putative Fe-S oxidoreductase [Fimbriiglobus ruber]